MKRFVSKLPLGTDKLRHKVRLESDPCDVGTQHCRFTQFDLLKRVAEDPAFTSCNGLDFQKMSMSHNGHFWVVETEVIEVLPDGTTTTDAA